MKINYLILSVLLISVLYSLYFGSSDQTPKTAVCKKDFFKTDKEKKYSYIYSSAFFGCKQKDDKEHYAYLPCFYNTGTGHLLSIAGLHIGSFTMLIFLFINFILYIFLPSFRKKGIPYFWFSLPIGIIASILYVYFIGPEIPRLRAIIMLLFSIFAFFVPVFKNKLFILAITASLILFFMPDSIYSYSFFYSFIAVLGIFLSSARKTLYICIAIYLFLIPLNLHSSGTFDVNNILANLVVIPFFSFIYYPINIILIVLFASGLHAVIYIMNVSTYVLLLILKFFSRISDFTKIKTFNLNTIEVVILYAVLILFFISIKYYRSFNRKKVIWLYLATASIIISMVTYLEYENVNNKELINFELQKPRMIGGSGDIIFVNTGSKNLIIDTGFGGFDSQKIIKEIKRNKIDNIDYLIVTHNDADHAGGIEDFLNEFYVHNIIISPSEYIHVLQRGLVGKTNFLFACDGMSFNVDNYNTIRFLHPDCNNEQETMYERRKNKLYSSRAFK